MLDLKQKIKDKRGRSALGRVLGSLLAVYAAFICMLGGVDYLCPDTISVYGYGIVTDHAPTEARGTETDTVLPFGQTVFCSRETTALTIGGVLPLKIGTITY